MFPPNEQIVLMGTSKRLTAWSHVVYESAVVPVFLFWRAPALSTASTLHATMHEACILTLRVIDVLMQKVNSSFTL